MVPQVVASSSPVLPPHQHRSWLPVSAHTWRLEVDASHFHRVLGVVGGEVGVVQ